MHRRELLKNGAVALTVAAARPLFAWQGANNRVRMAVIGMGGRSGRVFDSLTRYDDVQFTMGCEVAQNKQTGFQSANRPLAQTLNVVGDYRRVLERNDIDAVLIGTPDFSHARITADALAAGKHVYVEKPISNNIARINMMLDAYNKYPNLVVQVGTQQRSWDHFIEAKKQMALAWLLALLALLCPILLSLIAHVWTDVLLSGAVLAAAALLASGPPFSWPVLGSKVSVWLGPPFIQSRMQLLCFGLLLDDCSAARAASRFNQPEVGMPNAPTAESFNRSRRERERPLLFMCIRSRR